LTEVFGTTIDVTDRTRAEEERTRLLGRVISAHEDERLRISREIHDEVGQQLSVLSLKVSTLKEDYAGQADIRAQIESIEGVLQQLDSDVDFLVWNLRPTALDELGLLVVISNVIAHWTKHFGTHAELHTVGMEQRRVTSDVGVVLYRVLQEALNNVAKHAIARNVHIFLERRVGHVSLIVEDDGKGFETEQVLSTSKGFGLIGMRERAALLGGTLEIESHPARGTTLVVQIPLSGVSTSEEHDG
jgi:signal transduction histidine kinase